MHGGAAVRHANSSSRRYDRPPSGMARLWVAACLIVHQLQGPLLASAPGRSSDVFNAAEFGAVDDGITNNTAAFSACLEALVAAGGGKMVLPRSRLGIYRGNIIIPPMQIWTTVEIVGGGAQPTPVILATAVTESLSLCSATDMSVLWTDCSGKASSPGRR